MKQSMEVEAAVPSFHALFEAHADYVYRLARHFGIADRDADDVVQEVFVIVLRRLPEYEPRAAMRTWLYAIVWRVASDHRQRAYQRRERLGVSLPEEPAEPAHAPDASAARSDARRRLEQALAALPEEQRVVFLSYEVEELPMETIADGLGCPLKTAYSRLRLARERLRAALVEP
jgi:RNA polymerase sigma-70 factor (ECF subfamily)